LERQFQEHHALLLPKQQRNVRPTFGPTALEAFGYVPYMPTGMPTSQFYTLRILTTLSCFFFSFIDWNWNEKIMSKSKRLSWHC
jgi:hypothetical protein